MHTRDMRYVISEARCGSRNLLMSFTTTNHGHADVTFYTAELQKGTEWPLVETVTELCHFNWHEDWEPVFGVHISAALGTAQQIAVGNVLLMDLQEKLWTIAQTLFLHGPTKKAISLNPYIAESLCKK